MDSRFDVEINREGIGSAQGSGAVRLVGLWQTPSAGSAIVGNVHEIRAGLQETDTVPTDVGMLSIV